MCDWLDMIGTYALRNVANYKCDRFTLDTSRVTDRDYIYETAVKHKDFNGGEWIILEGVNTKEEAMEAHCKWFDRLTADDVTDLYCIYECETYRKGE